MIFYLDFETRSACDIRKAGADVYARHPSTDILCMGYAYGDGPVKLWRPGDGSNLFWGPDTTFVAHNAPFEIAIWNHVGVRRYGWLPIKPEQTICTMAMAYAMALPGSLDMAAQAAGLEHKKDMAGNRIMMQVSQPRDFDERGNPIWWDELEHPEKFVKLYEYCKQDVEVERALFKRLMQLSARERDVWLLDQKINQRGVAIDKKAVEAAIALVKAEKQRLDDEMKRVTENKVATCTATGQLKDWLGWNGVETDGVAKSDVVDLLARDDLPPHCRAALLLRQEAAKSSTAKLESMLKSACEDSRIRGIFQYHGAATGRWAGRRIQPQNFPRPKLPQDQINNIFGILREIEL